MDTKNYDDNMIGQLLDRRYQVVQVLGTGGFGQTYIAHDTHRPGNPTCVVKHLKPASSDPKILGIARRLFNNEAETLEQLGNNDQIPRLLAYFEENQEFYLVQELIEGHRLSAELLPDQRWNENQVIGLLQEVLNVLEFVHSQGVIHRDVKPDNLIRRHCDHKLVLVDFGAVKQVQTQLVTVQGQLTASVAIGTPGYMPTEQGQGKPRPNSDIYALGMIGIQALTGMSPTRLQKFEHPDTGELNWQKLATVSPELERVLTKMVSYHFKDRYPSATETLQALQQVLSSYTPTQFVTLQQGIGVQSSGKPTTSSPATISRASTGSNAVSYSNSLAGEKSSQASGVSSPRQWQLLIGSGTVAAVIAIGITLAMTVLHKPHTKSVSVTTVSPTQNSLPKTNQRASTASPNSNAKTNQKATVASPTPSSGSTPQPEKISPAPSSDLKTKQGVTTTSPAPSFKATPQPEKTLPVPSSDLKTKQQATTTSPAPSSDLKTKQGATTTSPTPSFKATPQPEKTLPAPSSDLKTKQGVTTTSPALSSNSTASPFEPPPDSDQLPPGSNQPSPNPDQSPLDLNQPLLNPSQSSPNSDQPSPNSNTDDGAIVLARAKAELDAGNVKEAINLLQSIPPNSAVAHDVESLTAQVEQMHQMCESNPYWGKKQGAVDPTAESNLQPGDEMYTHAMEWNQLKCWNFSINQW